MGIGEKKNCKQKEIQFQHEYNIKYPESRQILNNVASIKTS